MSRKLAEEPEDEAENTQSNSTAIQCFKCNALGHKAVNCPTRIKSCFCVASKDTKLETVNQMQEDLEDKVRMVILCNVVK